MERMTNDTPYWKEMLSAHDAISRRMAIEKFEPWLKVDGYSEGELNMLKAVLYELRFLPSVQPEVTEEAVKEYCRKRCLCIVDSALLKKYASAQPDCSDCIEHGGDWDCDHVHCHKGKSAQPERFNPCTVCQEFDCTGCKFRRTE